MTHRFHYKYEGEDGEGWEVTGEGESVGSAWLQLAEKIEMQGCELEPADVREIGEYVLQAVVQPGVRQERRDFSTPEENFSVVYEKFVPHEAGYPTMIILEAPKNLPGI